MPESRNLGPDSIINLNFHGITTEILLMNSQNLFYGLGFNQSEEKKARNSGKAIQLSYRDYFAANGVEG